MFINSISLENIRTFAATKEITFIHPDRVYGEKQELKHAPKLKNVNLIFGLNSSGKTSLLEAIALSAGATAAVQNEAQDWVRIYTSPKVPHTNCMQSFKAIYDADPDRARQLISSAKHFLQKNEIRLAD